MAKKAEPVRVSGSQLERAQEILRREFPPLPEVLVGTLDLHGWIAALIADRDYTEPDPGYLQREMALNLLLADDSVLTEEATGLIGLQDTIAAHPGATTGPIRITDIYVVPSSIEEGGKTFIILTYYSMETNEVFRRSGGSHAVQLKLVRYLMAGVWPIDCQIVRTPTKLQGGTFMLDIWPVD